MLSEKCEVMFRYAKKYPKISRFWFGPALMKLWVLDPELLKIIFNHPLCLQKPEFYRFFGWGSGLVTANGIKYYKRQILSTFLSVNLYIDF